TESPYRVHLAPEGYCGRTRSRGAGRGRQSLASLQGRLIGVGGSNSATQRAAAHMKTPQSPGREPSAFGVFGIWVAGLATQIRNQEARLRYSPVRVSISILSPMLQNSGTDNSNPVDSLAGFMTLPEVSPLTAGSVYSMVRTTVVGSSTEMARPS